MIGFNFSQAFSFIDDETCLVCPKGTNLSGDGLKSSTKGFIDRSEFSSGVISPKFGRMLVFLKPNDGLFIGLSSSISKFFGS